MQEWEITCIVSTSKTNLSSIVFVVITHIDDYGVGCHDTNLHLLLQLNSKEGKSNIHNHQLAKALIIEVDKRETPKPKTLTLMKTNTTGSTQN